MNYPPQLKKGSQGKEVALLQALLSLPSAPSPALAVFDEATHQAVLAFQRQKQLMTDGIVGPQTWFALGLVVPEVPAPQASGTITPYRAVIRTPLSTSPRIYYVNGIQTDGATHARTVYALSALTQRVVYGVFNATWSKGSVAGFGVDLGQCVLDWAFGVTSKLIEISDAVVDGIPDQIRKLFGTRPAPGTDSAQLIDRIIGGLSPTQRGEFCSAMFLFNRATKALYEQLRDHVGEHQIIVAHSQGNLITANALWAMTIMRGPAALGNMYVYSLASPAPAWPLGIRHRLRAYHHDNDLVVLANPHNWRFIRERYARALGQFDEYEHPTDRFDPHFIYNFGKKSFAHDLRKRLGLNDIQDWVFPR
jgi:hypothetical protein